MGNRRKRNKYRKAPKPSKAMEKYTPKGKTVSTVKPYTYSMCDHSSYKDGSKGVVLPSGLSIYPTSNRWDASKSNSGMKYDFGLYFDRCWAGSLTSRNEFVNWPDFGLPKDFDMFDEQIKDAWAKVKAGKNVQIGCIGAHGRTGTALGCFFVLDGGDAAKAKDWVRSNHCSDSIETAEQEWFILAFAARMNGEDAPERPQPKPRVVQQQIKNINGTAATYGKYQGTGVTSTFRPKVTNCRTYDHFYWWIIGAEECPAAKATNTKCNTWGSDSKGMDEGREPNYLYGLGTPDEHIERAFNGKRHPVLVKFKQENRLPHYYTLKGNL